MQGNVIGFTSFVCFKIIYFKTYVLVSFLLSVLAQARLCLILH